MVDLKTKYMGIQLGNPVIAGASSLTSDMDTIRKLEDAGAGAIVIKSLFEEQVVLESLTLEDELHRNDNLYGEMLTVFPEIKHSGPDEHLMWVRKAKEACSIPVFGSLNATSRETWVKYAQLLEETGVDGLELNFYSLPSDFDRDAAAVEKDQLEILKEIRSKVKVPISVKLSAYYTAPLEFIRKLDKIGVNGLVLFNRLFQPSIDVYKEENEYLFNLSTPNDYRLPLRFSGLLFGEVKASVCASNGIHGVEQAAAVLLAGANCFQMVSSLYKNGIRTIGSVKDGLSQWMEQKGYNGIDDVRGRLSRKNNPERWAFNRSQYVKILLQPERYLERPINL